MRKIEIVHVFRMTGDVKCVILLRFPFWMKWIIRFVDCIFIPDASDYVLVEDKITDISLKKMAKQLSAGPPSFLKGIGAIS